jgi:hypothetical protein
MYHTLQLLFILFYFGSSYAVTQERVRLIVSEVQHSRSHSGRTHFDAGCKQLNNGFPNFQRAKPKTICSLCLGRNQAACLFRISGLYRKAETTSHILDSDLESVSPRAPPSQAGR